MFKLTDKDSTILDQQNIVERIKISDKDPFMNKTKPIWNAIHKPVVSTDELMQTL